MTWKSPSGILKICIWLCAPLVLPSCVPQGEKLTIASEQLEPLLEAARKFPRESFGFSPIPSKVSTVVTLIRGGSGEGYDWLLKIGTLGEKTIAFSKDSKKNDVYRWVQETETFYGPNYVESHTGQVRERINLIYEVKKISAPTQNELHVFYTGSSPILSGKSVLALEDVRIFLRTWSSSPPKKIKPKTARSSASSILVY